ncbi:MAG TPA: hypothetical protein VMH28_27600 [Candidatus Acidoferrales bacterium]|nr:hypothetical protein [Candidatus Acidoferrales bacterium]
MAAVSLSAQSAGLDAASTPGVYDAAPVPDSRSPLPYAPSTLAPAPLIKPAAPVVPVRPSATGSNASGETEQGVDWTGVFRASVRFLAIEHTFRLLTEPGTREGLKGPFLHNYADAVSNLHGWADGDEFYVNYVGHPMQGSVAGFLWIHNDRRYRAAEFGQNRLYWKSRLRAAAFAWAYSTQFEIGIASEASIGGIQAQFPQQGFVDHVVTPSIGMGWMVAEDAVDKYVIKRVEGATGNRWVRMAVRTGLNPSRTFANFLNGEAPWHRETRGGILGYAPWEYSMLPSAARSGPARPQEIPDITGVAPFEFNMTFQPEVLTGGGKSTPCLGGGGTAALRLAQSWQMVFDVGGCKMTGLQTNLSGDSLTYMLGPRWTVASRGPWSAHVQLLVGGNKLTQELMFPEKKKLLEAAAKTPEDIPAHSDYTKNADSNGFAVAMGGGVDYRFNRAVGIRVAELSYRHSLAGPVFGREYPDSLKLACGLVLHMGTW